MAKLIQPNKEEHLDYLRLLIINKFTKPIVNTYDCKILEKQIQETIQKRLSIDTIARLFLIKKSNSASSIFTLNTCSNYVGYDNWQGLINSFSEQNGLHQKAILFAVIQKTISLEELFSKLNACSKTPVLYETVNQIILYKSLQKDEVFFNRLFELHTIFEFEESYKYAIYHTIHLLGSLCELQSWLSEIAIANYHNLPFKENYMVEWLVVPKMNYYLPLLENCYKNNLATAAFYHLIHCTHFAETNQWDSFLKHYNKIENSPKNNMLEMRWLGVQLYYDNQFEKSLNRKKLVVEIIKNPCTNAKDAGDRVSSIFMICNYLFVIEAFEVIITLFEQKTAKYSSILGYWAELNYNQLKVYYAFSLVKNNRKEEGIMIFNQIIPDRFDLNFNTRMNSEYKALQILLTTGISSLKSKN
ncbi:hypothetical protein MCEGE10_01485 [Flavobacteriaceae bacterium]